jgi:putative transcriptional regulator
LASARHATYHGVRHVGGVRNSSRSRPEVKGKGIPSLVRELRRRLELTQEQFAQKVGVTYSTVNHWENGKRVPLPFLVKRLVEIKEELDGKKKGKVR